MEFLFKIITSKTDNSYWILQKIGRLPVLSTKRETRRAQKQLLLAKTESTLRNIHICVELGGRVRKRKCKRTNKHVQRKLQWRQRLD
jgi:hypothetical protein